MRYLAAAAVLGLGAGAAVGAREGSSVPDSVGPAARSLARAAAVPDDLLPRFRRAAGGPHDPQRASTCAGNAAGAAWADVDGDGNLDVYLPDPSGPGQLWVAGARARFTRRSLREAGIPAASANAASFADYDDDGRPDLYIAARGPDLLLHNLGGGRFEDVATTAGTADSGPGTSAAWADYDGDGRLDVFVTDGDNCGEARATPDHLFRNDGGGRFADVTSSLGGGGSATDGIGLQGVWSDVDGDGDPDLYLANDHLGLRANQLWRNDGAGPRGWRFTPAGRSSGAAVAMSSMGAASGDVDGDGRPDLVISDMGRPPLVLLRRGRSYAARTLPASPASRHPISWGVALADFDNDGHADVLAAGGALGLDRGRQPDTLYLGNGRGGFAVAGRASGIGDGGRGRGVAVADVNRDGLLDVLITRLGQAPLLLVNHGAARPTRRHWLELTLRGTRSPRDPCGAVVRATAGRWRAVRTLSCGSDGAASSEHLVHLGLGSRRRVRLTIHWPSGRRQQIVSARADRRLTVVEPR